MSVSDVFRSYCLKAARTMTFLLKKLALPSAFLKDTGKADVSRAGRSGDKCVCGEKASGRG